MTPFRVKRDCLILMAYHQITRMGIALCLSGLPLGGVALIHWSCLRSLAILARMKPALVEHEAEMARRLQA